MACDISTGQITCAPTPANCSESASGSSAMFDAFSSSLYSRVYVVEPGMALLVSVFRLPDNGVLQAYKVALPAGTMPQGESCPTSCTPCAGLVAPTWGEAVIAYEKPVKTNGVLWRVSEEDDTKMLTTPGAYRFVLSDEALIGDTYIEARFITLGTIPAPLIFGSAHL